MTDWNKRYGERAENARPPSGLLRDLIKTLPPGKALDVAAGTGRNAIFLAQYGYMVDAVDSSPVAMEKGRKLAGKADVDVKFITADLKDYTFAKDSYDLIISFNFLDRSLIPSMKNALKKGGAILFESFTVDQREIGPPQNGDYLLANNELLSLFDDLYISFYREGIFEDGERKKALASIVARKTDRSMNKSLKIDLSLGK
ncbi:MAG: methyltransferase domain-containing protein [bacterium]|nr:methyltransferase domain-containing protein [bacterium]